jgi:TRAP-type C4-dicarboxylate transport system permease small subunit
MRKGLVRTILSGYHRVLQALMTFLMGVMIIPVSLQIFSRYTGFIPRYIWTEEAARFCFMWVIMIGAMIGVRDGTHFNVDVIPMPASPRGRALLDLAVDFFLLVTALAFVWYGYGYAVFGYHQISELTSINLAWIYSMYFIAGLTWVVFLGERVLDALKIVRGDQHDTR